MRNCIREITAKRRIKGMWGNERKYFAEICTEKKVIYKTETDGLGKLENNLIEENADASWALGNKLCSELIN